MLWKPLPLASRIAGLLAAITEITRLRMNQEITSEREHGRKLMVTSLHLDLFLKKLEVRNIPGYVPATAFLTDVDQLLL